MCRVGLACMHRLWSAGGPEGLGDSSSSSSSSSSRLLWCGLRRLVCMAGLWVWLGAILVTAIRACNLSGIMTRQRSCWILRAARQACSRPPCCTMGLWHCQHASAGQSTLSLQPGLQQCPACIPGMPADWAWWCAGERMQARVVQARVLSQALWPCISSFASRVVSAWPATNLALSK